MSRPPGYPLYEGLRALLPAGPLAANALSAVASAVAAVALCRLLARLGVRDALALAAAFALTPIVYLHSTDSMDYMPALAAALVALTLAEAGRPALAGLCLGLAAGLRLHMAGMALPAALLLWGGGLVRPALGPVLVMGLAAAAATALAFLPVLAAHGLGALTFIDNPGYPSLKALAHALSIGVWGWTGSLALLAAAAGGLVWAVRAPPDLGPRRGAALAAAAAGAALYLAAFLRVPHDPAYLIPLVPLALLAAGILLPRPLTLAFAAGLALAPFVALGPGIQEGQLLRAHAARIAAEARVARQAAAGARLPEGTVIVAGHQLPAIRHRLRQEGRDAGRWVAFLDTDAEGRRIRAEGREIRFLPGMDAYNQRHRGVSLTELGGRVLQAP